MSMRPLETRLRRSSCGLAWNRRGLSQVMAYTRASFLRVSTGARTASLLPERAGEVAGRGNFLPVQRAASHSTGKAVAVPSARLWHIVGTNARLLIGRSTARSVGQLSAVARDNSCFTSLFWFYISTCVVYALVCVLSSRASRDADVPCRPPQRGLPLPVGGQLGRTPSPGSGLSYQMLGSSTGLDSVTPPLRYVRRPDHKSGAVFSSLLATGQLARRDVNFRVFLRNKSLGNQGLALEPAWLT